ncbi:MAG: hypothetical protein J7L37_03495 [Thermococcus sp.]|nr:hypothetical protein [Thermococcus sp.]
MVSRMAIFLLVVLMFLTPASASIQKSLLTPRGGIEVTPLYVSTNGSVAFIHFLIIRACSGGCSQCPFSTYAEFLKCTIYSGSPTGWFYPAFQFDGKNMTLLNLPNTTCNYTVDVYCTTPLVNWTGKEWRMYVWEGGDNVTMYRYYPERKCIEPKALLTNGSCRPFELVGYRRFNRMDNGTLEGQYVVFRFNGSVLRVPADDLLPSLQYREMLKHLEAMEFKGGYLILLKDYVAFDASNFNYQGWAVFPNDCDVLKNETQWAKCVGEHLPERDEIKPYPVFYYKNGRVDVFHPLEGQGVVLKLCSAANKGDIENVSQETTSPRTLEYMTAGGLLITLLALILRRRQ